MMTKAAPEEVYPDFTRRSLCFAGQTRTVFEAGEGPGVIVIHESPGLYPGVVEFGRRLVAQGYHVSMPSLTGTPGRDISVPYALETLVRACVSKEFTLWATGQNSPITDWLRHLAQDVHARCGGPGVGAIGMCLTGGFALAMMVEEAVIAPVLSQPSLPFGVTPRQKRDLGIDDATLARVKARTQEGVCVLGLRFSHDLLSPTARFVRLREELGENFLAVEIDSSRNNPHGIGPFAHSVLVFDFVDQPTHPTYQALQTLLTFLQERLQPSPD